MNKKIAKLLFSKNEDDVLIGWELLNLPENKPEGEEWYPYFDIFRANMYVANGLNLITEVTGEKYTDSELWINWEPKEVTYEDI